MLYPQSFRGVLTQGINGKALERSEFIDFINQRFPTPETGDEVDEWYALDTIKKIIKQGGILTIDGVRIFIDRLPTYVDEEGNLI